MLGLFQEIFPNFDNIAGTHGDEEIFFPAIRIQKFQNFFKGWEVGGEPALVLAISGQISLMIFR